MDHELRELLRGQASLMQRRRLADQARAEGRIDDAEHARQTRRTDEELADCRRRLQHLRRRLQKEAVQVKEEFDRCGRRLAELGPPPEPPAPDDDARRREELRARQATLAARFRHLRALWKARTLEDLPPAASAETVGAAPAAPVAPAPVGGEGGGEAETVTLELVDEAEVAGSTRGEEQVAAPPATAPRVPLTPIEDVSLIPLDLPTSGPPASGVPLVPLDADQPRPAPGAGLLVPLDERPPRKPPAAESLLQPLGEESLLQPLDAAGDVSLLVPLSKRWATPGRILVILAASLLLLAMFLPWLEIPAAALAEDMARAMTKELASAFGESPGEAPERAGPRFLTGVVKGGNAFLMLVLVAALFVPARRWRGGLWWLAGTLGLGLLVWSAWDHGLRLAAWGQTGVGLKIGAYVGAMALVVAMVGGGIAGWPSRAFRRAAAAGPLCAVAAGAFLFTHAFGTMADRAELSVGEATLDKGFGAPRARATLVLANGGWNPLEVFAEGADKGVRRDHLVVKLRRQTDGEWQPCEPAGILSLGGRFATASLLNAMKGDPSPSGHVVAPGRQSEVPLTFQPAWSPGAGVADSRAGTYRIELWRAGGTEPLRHVELDVPGAEHPDVATRKQHEAIRRLLASRGAYEAWDRLKAVRAPSWGSSAAVRTDYQKLRADLWPRAAECALADLAKAPPGGAVPRDVLARLQELRLAPEARQPANRDLAARMTAGLRGVETRATRQELIARAEQAVDSGSLPQALAALERLARDAPGDAELGRLQKRLRDRAPVLVDGALRSGQPRQAWQLMSRPGLVAAGSADAPAWARRLRQCAKGLADAGDAATARAAMDRAQEVQPLLRGDASFQWERLGLLGSAATAADCRAFLERFGGHSRTPQVRLALLSLLARRALTPGGGATERELGEAVGLCEKVGASAALPPAARRSATLLSQALGLRRALASPAPDERRLLEQMEALYGLAETLRASAPAGGTATSGLPATLTLSAADVLGVVEEARKRLGWGLSLGEALDREEVRMTRRLNPAVVSDRASAAAALRGLSEHKLILLRCSQATVADGGVGALQKWALAGGTLWIQNSDMVYQFGYPKTGVFPVTRPMRAVVETVRGAAGTEARVLEGLPDRFGTYDLPLPCYGLSLRVRGKYVNILQVRLGTRTGCFVASTRFGKGASVLLSLPIDRTRPGVSRLIFNLKRDACETLPKQDPN